MFRGEKRFEHELFAVCREPDPAIRHRHVDAIGGHLLDAQLHDALGRRRLRHRLAGVDDEIHHDLQQLHLVPLHSRQAAEDLRLHADPRGSRRRTREGQRLADNRLHRYRFVPRRVAAEQRSQTRDDVRCLLVLPGDVFQDQAYLLEIGRFAPQQQQTGLRVRQNRRDRLAQLVSQRAGELTGRGDARDARELIALVVQRGFRVFSLADRRRE